MKPKYDNEEVRKLADKGLKRCLRGLIAGDNYMGDFSYCFSRDDGTYRLSVWCDNIEDRKYIADYLADLFNFINPYQRDNWLLYDGLNINQLKSVAVLGKAV